MRKLILLIISTSLSLNIYAQFRKDGDDFRTVGPPGSNMNKTQNDTLSNRVYKKAPPSFTIKRYFKSLAGKDSMRINHMWMGSVILPGTAQIYNRQYWKLPVIYVGIGGLIYSGIHFNNRYRDTENPDYKLYRTLSYTGAALIYWGSMLDGVANYKYRKSIYPARASLYSALLPGLGQAYNGDLWKIPIIYTGMIVTGFFIANNQSQYKRYKSLYNEASMNPEIKGPYSIDALKWYRDSYRRMRDYSILAAVLVYTLNVIDASVFAHLNDFDISDDLSASFTPAVINTGNGKYSALEPPAVGISVQLRF